MKQILPDMKHIIVTNMSIPLYSWLLTFRKVVRQQIDGWWQFQIHIHLQILYEFNSEKIMKIGPRLPTFCHLVQGGPVIMTHHVAAAAVVVHRVPKLAIPLQISWSKIVNTRQNLIKF